MSNAQEISSVPAYDVVVERNQISILLQPGDLTVRGGDIALTKWGDLMLKDEDYSAFVRLVQGWRFNYPTLKVMFETVFGTFEEQQRLIQEGGNSFPQPTDKHPHPLFNPAMNAAAFNRAMDEHGAAEVAQGTYAGAIVVVISKALQSFKDNVVATQNEWETSGPLFGNCSVGQILVAAANNVRHNDEWAKTRPPNVQQLTSIKVLAAALKEKIAADGSGHKFAREICPEILKLLSEGDLARLESQIFVFANDLLMRRQKRLPSQYAGPANH